MGLCIDRTAGIVITPWFHVVDRQVVPLPGRFSLTHERSGQLLASLPWCPHLTKRWGEAAGWIGVDWMAQPFTLLASGPARTFVWRLFDEYRPHCDRCGPVPVADDHGRRMVDLFRSNG
jgi:hypothetical protein